MSAFAFPKRPGQGWEAAVATLWAIGTARAALRICRPPPPQCSGDRIPWVRLDPRVLREWAMVPMAITAGCDVNAAGLANGAT